MLVFAFVIGRRQKGFRSLSGSLAFVFCPSLFPPIQICGGWQAENSLKSSFGDVLSKDPRLDKTRQTTGTPPLTRHPRRSTSATHKAHRRHLPQLHDEESSPSVIARPSGDLPTVVCVDASWLRTTHLSFLTICLFAAQARDAAGAEVSGSVNKCTAFAELN